MTNSVIYLIQLIAAALIIGGSLIITLHMVCGEHCFHGWLIVFLGSACLIIGSHAGGD